MPTIRLDTPLPFRSVSVPGLDPGVTITEEATPVSEEVADALFEALEEGKLDSRLSRADFVVEGYDAAEEEPGFASAAAEKLAAEHQLTPEDLGEPSGKTGYTKADVEAQVDSGAPDSEASDSQTADSQSEDASGEESEGE